MVMLKLPLSIAAFTLNFGSSLLHALATLPLGKETWYLFSNLSNKTDVKGLLESTSSTSSFSRDKKNSH
jgi:hypothetical protein